MGEGVSGGRVSWSGGNYVIGKRLVSLLASILANLTYLIRSYFA
jgi:hypothetical protein